MKNLFRNFISLLLVFLIIVTLLSAFGSKINKTTEITIDQFLVQLKNNEISEVTVKDTSLEVMLKAGTKETMARDTAESFGEFLKNYNIDPSTLSPDLKIKVEDSSGLNFWISVGFQILLPVLLIGGFIYFMTRQVQGANRNAMMFGQTRAEDKNPKEKKDRVQFKDVAGVKEAKEELEEIVEFLTKPQKFIALGAKIPRGVLLMGAPGTGKTLLAKAVAGEANVPFFSISGSEFVEMFVGVGASRVRDLFEKAKKQTPCIIFIDEIDAVGRQRGAGLGGSHDEREQTLNQILVEMDGFNPNAGTIVIAATNRPDVLDAALLRPGRFDRRIVLNLPDIQDRLEILKVHSREKVFNENIDLKNIAERTPGFSGADLANLLNEAAILAARRNQKKVEKIDILESIEKVIMGPERKTKIISAREKQITAYHEAGHAIVSHCLEHSDPVHKVSIIARGHAAGYTLSMPTEDKNFHTRNEFIDDLAVLLGGRVAEEIFLNENTTGASNDLQKATDLAKSLVTTYGMSNKLGPRTFGHKDELIFLGKEIHEGKNYSEKAAEAIDQEISDFVNTAKATAEKIIKQEKPLIEKLVAVLMEKESIEKDEFEKICGPKKTSKTTA